jgi:hypothetical protein
MTGRGGLGGGFGLQGGRGLGDHGVGALLAALEGQRHRPEWAPWPYLFAALSASWWKG